MREGYLNRRNFLRLTSLGSAGVFLGLSENSVQAMMRGMGMGMGMTGGGISGLIDPPPGEAFRDPVQLSTMSSVPGVVDVSLEAKVSPVRIGYGTANLATYNGCYGGPTIRVKNTDRLLIRFRNSLPRSPALNMLGHERDVTNIHTHGLHVSPLGKSDNVHLQFSPGQEFLYEYDLSKQAPGALCFYHPHIHGTVAEQVWSGMAGALLVEDGSDALAAYETHLLVLKDISLWGAEPEPYLKPMDYMHGKTGRMVMVNGQINPVLPIKPGQVQRWRVLNASNARFYKLFLENHPLHAIGTDGGLLDRPYPLSSLLLSPGERIDVLVRGSQTPANYRLLSLPYANGCHGGCHGGNGQTITLMTMACTGAPANDAIPASINPEARRVAVDIASLPKQSMVLSMGMGMGFINGRTFGQNTFTINSRVGTYELWEISNFSHMGHPFHQHVNAAQVLAVRGGDPEYASFYTTAPAWKDTVVVPAMGSVTLLVPVMDFPGMVMMHCHILEHEDIGMMGMWNIADAGGNVPGTSAGGSMM